MDLVSVIHSSHTYRKIPFQSFEDIRLTQILPEGVISVMQQLPSEEDISRRREVFKYLYDRGTDELEQLTSELRNIEKIYRSYESAEGVCKSYIFAALIFRISDFYMMSSQIGCRVSFFAEYQKQFGELYDPELHSRFRSVYESLVRSASIILKKDRVVIQKNGGKGFIPAIRECAAAMGLTFDAPDPVTEAIDPALAKSIIELYPELCGKLEELYSEYSSYPDKGLLDYIPQFEFYIYNTSLLKSYSAMGLPHCYPRIVDTGIRINEAYDITLMSKECDNIIPNDIVFSDDSPIFFLAGANGGGKTTYLRTCGVTCALALNGCPVPARSAVLPMLDSLLTHFPRDERFDLEGRFLDEQNRVEYLLSVTGKKSLVLLNETYATTNEEKAAEMTCQLAEKLRNMGQYSVYVTHQKKAFDLDIPMLACVIDENDGNRRTYKIRPVDASVSSHAQDILKKYSLTGADLEKRFGI